MLSIENKKAIAFIGDSIIENGVFINYIRKSLKKSNIENYIFNKGYPGFRMDIAHVPLEEDFDLRVPDYAVICFGINDIGIWLYDSYKEENETLIKERNERMKKYEDSLPKLIDKLRKYSVTPIIASPFCVDSDITEREDIDTVTDNKEKADYIGESFYKKETFRRINIGLAKMRDILKNYAEKEKIQFVDFFEYSINNFRTEMFAEDGTHILPEGHKEIAKCFLKEINVEMDNSPLSQEIIQLREEEALERGYFFIKYGFFLEQYMNLTNSEMHTKIDEFVKTKGYADGVSEVRKKGFDLLFCDKEKKFRKGILEKIISINSL